MSSGDVIVYKVAETKSGAKRQKAEVNFPKWKCTETSLKIRKESDD